MFEGFKNWLLEKLLKWLGLEWTHYVINGHFNLYEDGGLKLKRSIKSKHEEMWVLCPTKPLINQPVRYLEPPTNEYHTGYNFHWSDKA